MKTLTLEFADAKKEKLIKDFAAKNGIGIKELALDDDVAHLLIKTSNKLSKAEQAYEDKVDRNLLKMIDQQDKRGVKMSSRESVMKILNRK